MIFLRWTDFFYRLLDGTTFSGVDDEPCAWRRKWRVNTIRTWWIRAFAHHVVIETHRDPEKTRLRRRGARPQTLRRRTKLRRKLPVRRESSRWTTTQSTRNNAKHCRCMHRCNAQTSQNVESSSEAVGFNAMHSSAKTPRRSLAL